MARSLFLACLLALCWLLVAAAGASGRSPARASVIPGSSLPRMADHINRARLAHGLPPLRRSRSLAGSAGAFSRHLTATQRFAHASRIYASARFRRHGEILLNLSGHSWQRALAVRLWLASPSHRAVLLSRSFRYVGAGRTAGFLRGRPATIWVVHFGSL